MAKTVYFEEQVRVLEKTVLEADPILSELAALLADFERVSKQPAKRRDLDLQRKYGLSAKDYRRKLHISFSEERELEVLKADPRLKLNARNSLGVKSKDDWIFNLNIGNVMHLNCLQADELHTQIDRAHEFSRDAMLEKVVLVASAYYCVAMELQFLVSEGVTEFTHKDAETFHAKALHLVLTFLPPGCPLSQHFEETYFTTYLKSKIKPSFASAQKPRQQLFRSLESKKPALKPVFKVLKRL